MIKQLRKEFNAPNAKFVTASLGQTKKGATDGGGKILDAMLAVDGESGKYPEFKGNVAIVQTDVYWDMTADKVFRKGWREHREEWEQVGSDYPYHYLGSPTTYLAIGEAFARAILEL